MTFNDQQIFFTCSLDQTVKAWTVSQDQSSLMLAGEMNLQAQPTCMRPATASLLLIGMNNGSLAGWDLGANKIDYMQVHQGPNCAITYLKKYMNLIFTGDFSGRVQLRNIDTGYGLFLPEYETLSKFPVSDIQPVSPFPGQDWIIVGDNAGIFTALKVDAANLAGVHIGAFNDTKTESQKKVVCICMTDGQTMHAMSAGGVVRTWRFS